MMDWFKVIGSDPSNSISEINASFKSYVVKNHPDKNRETDSAVFSNVISSYKKWREANEAKKTHHPEQRDPEIFRGQIGDDVHLEIIIDFIEAYNGTKKKVRVRSPNTNGFCEACSGSGSSDPNFMIECINCGGNGCVISSKSRTHINKEQCQRCRGSGQLPVFECALCSGTGKSETDRSMIVKIPPGSFDGTILKVRGAGGYGDPPGDLYLNIRVRSHPKFKINDGEIQTRVKLNPTEFILGCEKEILFPDGEKRPIKIDGSREVRIASHGVPGVKNSKFTIYPELKIPKEIPKELIEVLEKIQWP